MPTTAREITGRINQITFSQPMLRDIEVIETVRALAALALARQPGRLRVSPAHRFHLIDAGRFTSTLAPESKGKPDIELLTYLHGAGRSETEKWLARHRRSIGRRARWICAGSSSKRTVPEPPSRKQQHAQKLQPDLRSHGVSPLGTGEPFKRTVDGKGSDPACPIRKVAVC